MPLLRPRPAPARSQARRACWRWLATGLALAASALTLATPARVEAGACCLSAAAYGVGRLKSWESMAAGSSLSLRHTYGHWSAQGRYADLRGARADDLRGTLWTLVRVHRSGAVWVRVPGHLGLRSAPGDAGEVSTQAASPGDLDLGLRWDWVGVGEAAGRAGVATTLGLTVPTGRTYAESSDALAADVSGRGAFALTLATTVERTLMPWFVRGVAALSVPLPAARADTGVVQRFGPSVSGQLAAGREVWSGLVVSARADVTWESALVSGGAPVAGSAALVSTASLALAWQAASDWTVQAGVGGSVPLSNLGRNREAQLITTLGVRYGYVP